MPIKKDHEEAVNPSNEKLFKAVQTRLGTVLTRQQSSGFIEAFSSEAKGGTGDKARHVAIYIKSAGHSARRDADPKLKDSDFNLYLTAGKTGPVTMTLFPSGHKARDLLKRITDGRVDEAKGPHIVAGTTSKEFKLQLNIIESVLERAGAKLHQAARKIDMAPTP